ncbi:MBL fold metallo-hydrolase [Frondihabitans sp. PAMC 28766]|uniref:MBL fold metallo-hydrolase n=1 Tax=Frondihabitans sp. PAMC 28766 TaxID=1795630 RepID=UPI0012FF74A1|nr:MBL fold metallo-hydrolase [Frondihabitans sp. PAMC 28766]
MRAAPGSHEVLLVDPSWEVDELEALADDLDTLGLTVVAGFSTHAHFDHLLWHPRFGDVPRWASATTVAVAAATRDILLDELGPWPEALVPLVGDVAAARSSRLAWGGQEVALVEHSGHVPGHTALWLPGPRILLAGDMLSDVEPPLPAADDSSLRAYAAGLDTLEPFVRQAALLMPGHGHATQDAAARLAADRRFVEAVASGSSPASVDGRCSPA